MSNENAPAPALQPGLPMDLEAARALRDALLTTQHHICMQWSAACKHVQALEAQSVSGPVVYDFRSALDMDVAG